MKKLVITITNNISFDQRIIKIADTLATKYDVTVLGVSTRNPLPLKDLRTALGEEVGFRPKRFKMLFQRGFLFYAEYNVRIFWWLLFSKFDIIYAVDLDSILGGSLVSRFTSKKLVFDSHEYFTELPEIVGRRNVKAIWEMVGYFSVPRSKLNISVNKTLSNILSEKYKNTFYSIKNVPHSSNTAPKNQSNSIISETNQPYFIYQGAINVGRGIPEIIKLMSEFPTYSLVICGSGPLLDTLKKQTESNPQIIFTGSLPFHQLKSITEKAEIGFNLLNGDSLNYYYSLANKFFDYSMAGIPSINMNFPVYVDMLKQFKVGITVDNLEHGTLVSAVKKIISDQKLIQEIKLNCGKANKNWNWDQEKTKLIELFKSI